MTAVALEGRMAGTTVPAAVLGRIRAALDAGDGIAVLPLRDLFDERTAARLSGPDPDAVPMAHMAAARVAGICQVHWFPAELPSDP
jgi:hypothetical protein